MRKVGAKNLNSFRRIWRNILISTKVVDKSGKKLMSSAWKKIRLIGYKGVLSTYKN